ncbi:type VI secretion system Vgr family protein [Burkholderia sp. Ax-1719]|uniref:type VI secretion system Vgr family protein n=1 Tax=Burkholderia sp. Ax-1719 TaxID=2608334 RepID=UPI00142257A0|nr:type VI secretion system Vgr family protein [Burkholderia sp. Ax-1719]NIE64385.1 type VI secretion system tip protein VgrG [Burkholderia sp. Ax-1719]
MDSTTLYNALNQRDTQYNRLVRLDSPFGADWLLPLYVKGTSRLGRDYEYVVDAVSARGDQIELDALIGKTVTLWIQQLDGSYMPVHGYVHRFSRLGADGPLTFYQIRFSSWLYFLRLRRDMRDWQEQGGQQILADVFYEHPQAKGALRFDLKGQLPSYSNRVQWEFDLNFVHRSMEEVGIFPYFEQADDGCSHTMVVMDDSYSLPQLRQPVVQFGRMGIGDELDGFTQWKEQLQIESAQLTSRSFDYKRPDLPRQVQGDTVPQNALPTDGEIYDYPGAYMWSSQSDGDQRGDIRLEERMSRMKRFHGAGALRCAMPGRRFELQGHPVHDSGSQADREFVLIEVNWLIRNNLPGMEGVQDFPDGLSKDVEDAKAAAKVRHADGSEGLYLVTVEALPRNVPFRSPFEHKKPVMQLQNAIVSVPGGQEVYTDSLNRAKVWFPWNRRNGQDERASCWVRTAFPDAGSNRGGVQPLRKGDEVLVGFMEGDCDRPVIISRLYGGATQPVWHSNGLLSGYRSREYGGSGYNQLVMDDSTQQNRVQLYSSSYESHLHLGYLIQHTDNTRGAFLGSGFDLKSESYGAIRAGQGLFVSTHPASVTQPLNATAASAQLASAESVVELASESSSSNQAESLQEGQDALKKFTDATQYSVGGTVGGSGGNTAGGGTGNANGFSTPIMLIASPAGVGVSTQDSAQLTANQQVNIVSGKSTHIAAGKSLIASVMEKISLFAQNAGIKLFAAKGKVEIQAQSDEMKLTALNDVTITSSNGKVVISADKEIWIGAGGSYIKITADLIENGTNGQILEKGASWDKPGASSMRLPAPITSVPKGCAWQTASASADSASSIALG